MLVYANFTQATIIMTKQRHELVGVQRNFILQLILFGNSQETAKFEKALIEMLASLMVTGDKGIHDNQGREFSLMCYNLNFGSCKER